MTLVLLQVMSITATINRSILDQKPRGWMKHLTNYANCDMVLPSLFDEQSNQQVLTQGTTLTTSYHPTVC